MDAGAQEPPVVRQSHATAGHIDRAVRPEIIRQVFRSPIRRTLPVVRQNLIVINMA